MTQNNVVSELNTVLGTTFVLYAQTHNFHWNVTGKRFYGFHMMYEQMYQDLFQALDDLAERIRQLGAFVDGSVAGLASHSAIQEVTSVPNDFEMFSVVTDNYRTLVQVLQHAIVVADEAKDSVTVDLLSARKAICDKQLWMLESSL